jgi:hypothetical protein
METRTGNAARLGGSGGRGTRCRLLCQPEVLLSFLVLIGLVLLCGSGWLSLAPCS